MHNRNTLVGVAAGCRAGFSSIFLYWSIGGIGLLPANLAAQCPITVDAGPDQFVCSTPAQITLDGDIGGSYQSFTWTPSAGMSGANTLNPTVSVSQTTAYILRAKAADYGSNLVDNGDFQQGNSGFSSDYNYNPNFWNYPFGSYDVTPAPGPPYTACPGHGGTGNYMCIDGAEIANWMVWCQSVPVTPNTEYLLSAWVTSINSAPPFASLQFTVNGVQIGAVFGAPGQCQWTQFTGIWNSGANTTANICIEDLTVSATNNDFGLDDIGFFPICIATDTVQVNVVNLLAVANPVVAQLPCEGALLTLNGAGSSVGPQISYAWDTPNGNIVSGENTLQPVIDAAGSYTLTVTYDFGTGECTRIATVTVIPAPNPLNVTINPPPILGCGSTQVVLNGFSSQGSVNYNWTTVGGNIVSGLNGPNATVNQAGAYTLTATNFLSGCSASATVTVLAGNNPPTAVATAAGGISCTQTQVNLSGAGSTVGAGIGYVWTTSNGVILSGQNTISAVAGSPGIYILTVSNTVGNCVAADTVSVPGNTVPPTVLLEPAGQLDCRMDSLQLLATINPASALPVWAAGNGGSIASGDSTSAPVVTAAGIYLLTVTDPANGCTATAQDTVTADFTPPVAQAQAPDTLTCLTTQVLLSGNGSSSGPEFVYLWSGGSILAGANTLFPTVDAPAQYTLVVTDTLNGCAADTSIWVTADTAVVVASANAPDLLTCAAPTVLLNANGSSPGVIYAWSTTGGQILAGADTPTPSVGAPGVYSLMVTNAANGCSASDAVFLGQNVQAPLAQILPPAQFTCLLTSQTLQVQLGAPGPFTYAWTASNGGAITAGANTPTPLISTSGTYALLLTDPANGCTNTQTVAVTVDTATPTASIAAPASLNCFMPQLTLDGSGSSTGPTISYAWTAANGGNIVAGGDSLAPTVDSAGDYQLLVSNSANGCTALATVQVAADVQAPDAAILPASAITCSNPQGTLFVVNPVFNFSYQWQTTDGQIIVGQNSAMLVIGSGGSYALVVTNPQNGCSAVDTVFVAQNAQTPPVQIQPPLPFTCALSTQTLHSQVSAPGIFAYAWTASNGGVIGAGADTPTPLVSAPGDYTLLVTDLGNGCTSSQSVSVPGDANAPTASALVPGILTCAVTQLTLDGNGSSMGLDISYAWTAANGGNIVAGSDSLTPLVNAPGDYQLLVSDASNGCTAVATAQVIADQQAPSVAAWPVDLFSCADLTDTILLVNPAPDWIYQWQTANGQIVAGQNTPALVIASAGDYMLSVLNPANGCSAVFTAPVLPDVATPFAAIAAPDTLTCAVGSILLSGNASIGPDFVYAWTGAGVLSGANTLTPVVGAPGPYSLLVTNTANGCTAQALVNIAADTSAPAVSIAAPPILTCAFPTAGLLAESTGNDFIYHWAGGNILTGINTATPTVGAAGIYALTVTNPQNGCSASASVAVDADQMPPSIDIQNPSPLTCTTLEMNLNGAVAAPASGFTVQWSSVGGNLLTGQNTLTPLVNAPGIYQMTVQNQQNGCTAIATTTVTADQAAPSVSAGTAANLTCTVLQTELAGTASAGGAPLSYDWSGPLVLTGANSPMPTVGAPGTYILLATNLENGCAASAFVVVGVDTISPTVNIAQPGLLTCATPNTVLNAAGSSNGAGFLLAWTTLGGNFISGQNTLTPTVDAPAVYRLFIENQQNGCTNTAAVFVEQNIEPPEAEAGEPKFLHCNQPETDLSGSSNTPGPLQWQWTAQPGGQIVSGADTQTPAVAAAGIYTLTVTRLDNGCTAADAVVVTEIPDPNFEVTATPPNCFEPTGTLAVGPITGGQSPFVVSADGGQHFQTNLLFEDLPPGSYALVLRDLNGCTSVQTVELKPPVLPAVQLPPNLTIELGDSLTLVPQTVPPPSGVADWAWSPPGGLSCTDCPEPVAIPLHSQTYSLIITDAEGCTAAAETRIWVDRHRNLYAPTIFSPNEDGVNDWFTLFGRGVVEIQELQIFDRWGSLLWEGGHLPIGVEKSGWNGRTRGRDAASGVYVWQAVVLFLDGQAEVFAGDVTILR